VSRQFRIPRVLWLEIEAAAREEMTTPSVVVRKIIRQWFNGRQDKAA